LVQATEIMRLTLLLLVFAASSAGAQSAAQAASEVRFQILDLDGDGYVSLAEAAGIGDVVERFDRADRDRDGYLSVKEFARLDHLKARATPQRERMRAAIARDVQASERHERQASAQTASTEGAPSAAAGASASRP